MKHNSPSLLLMQSFCFPQKFPNIKFFYLEIDIFLRLRQLIKGPRKGGPILGKNPNYIRLLFWCSFNCILNIFLMDFALPKNNQES